MPHCGRSRRFRSWDPSAARWHCTISFQNRRLPPVSSRSRFEAWEANDSADDTLPRIPLKRSMWRRTSRPLLRRCKRLFYILRDPPSRSSVRHGSLSPSEGFFLPFRTSRNPRTCRPLVRVTKSLPARGARCSAKRVSLPRICSGAYATRPDALTGFVIHRARILLPACVSLSFRTACGNQLILKSTILTGMSRRVYRSVSSHRWPMGN